MKIHFRWHLLFLSTEAGQAIPFCLPSSTAFCAAPTSRDYPQQFPIPRLPQFLFPSFPLSVDIFSVVRITALFFFCGYSPFWTLLRKLSTGVFSVILVFLFPFLPSICRCRNNWIQDSPRKSWLNCFTKSVFGISEFKCEKMKKISFFAFGWKNSRAPLEIQKLQQSITCDCEYKPGSVFPYSLSIKFLPRGYIFSIHSCILNFSHPYPSAFSISVDTVCGKNGILTPVFNISGVLSYCLLW